MQNVSSTRPYLGAILGCVSKKTKNAQFTSQYEKTCHVPKYDAKHNGSLKKMLQL